MSGTYTASLDQMRLWAQRTMATRGPDFVIGDNYLRRWWLVPRNNAANVYLHHVVKSDDDRALHDHPWTNTSYVLDGMYVEHTPKGSFERRAGDVVTRPATALHWLEIPDGGYAVSLFVTGPKVREWGFRCGHGWVHWRDFTDGTDSSVTGRGCGEIGDLTPVRRPGTKELIL